MQRRKDMKNPDLLRKELEVMCNRFGVEILYAFGSRAMEINRVLQGKSAIPASSLSDMDIGAKARFKTPFSVHDKIRLAVELEDLLDVNRVDLCLLNEADPFLAAEVIRGERLYCEDELRADEYELYVLRRAGDLAPLERQRLSLVLNESR